MVHDRTPIVGARKHLRYGAPVVHYPAMDKAPEALSGLNAAIRAAGSASALADRMGMVKSAVSNWRRREGGVPPQHVPSVCRHTGLPAHVVRPDLFPAPAEAAA